MPNDPKTTSLPQALPKLEPTDRPCARCAEPAHGIEGALCASCRDKANREDWGNELRKTIALVRDTLPDRFRVQDLEGPGLGLLIACLYGRNDLPAAQMAQRKETANLAIRVARELVAKPASVTIQGHSTRGKTSLAAAILVGYMRAAVGPYAGAHDDPGHGWGWQAARSCGYMRALHIPDGKVWTDGQKIDGEKLARARGAHALIVDDLGLEPPSPVTIELLLDRADRDQLTIVTTSLSVSSATTLYGDGVARRLFGEPEVIALDPGGLRQ